MWDHYNFIKILGEGTFGKVFQALHKELPPHSDQFVAIKIMDIKKIVEKPVNLKQLISEIKVHWVLEKCDSMLGLRQIYEDADFIYLVLDYQESGNLLNKIYENGKFSEAQTKIIME